MTAISAADLGELTPLIRRAVGLEPASLVRLRIEAAAATALVRLPFGVLVGRRIAGDFEVDHDGVYSTAQLLQWLEAEVSEIPPRRDSDWHVGLPPPAGWRRIETVPDDVIRGLVAKGALTLREAADREGVPGAQPRAEVTEALLDSIVLTTVDAANAAAGDAQVAVSLRSLSALVRMGFLARDSHLAIDIAGRWQRLTAAYGSAYSERPGLGLGLAGQVGLGTHPHGGIRR